MRKYECPLPWGVLILAFFGTLDILGAEEPEELTSLRQKYVERINEVKKPITRRHISSLSKIQKALNQSGNTDEALAVLQERSKLARLLNPEASRSNETGDLIAPTQPQEEGGLPGAFDPTGTTWNWRQPAKEITFLENGRAYVSFPNLGENPLPHYWKKVGLREIEVWYETGIVILKFEVNKNGKTGTVKSGESNAVTEVSLVAGKIDHHKQAN